MIEILKYKMTPQEILTANVGIEREGLRVTDNGKLSKEPHPKIFGNKLKNPYITIDFSESQVEIITPVFNSVKKSYRFLEDLTNIIITEIDEKGELFWPQSMPCDIPEDSEVPIGIYEGDEGILARQYREELMRKYGGKRQLISGIHYNFSFSETLITILWKESKSEKAYKEFKDAIYLKVSRNYLKFRWLIIYLMGSSSGAHASYIEECLSHMNAIGKNTYISDDVISIRNSSCGGYKNMIDLFPDYSSIDHFIESINDFIENGDISDVKELYASIRLKAYQNRNMLDSLKKDGIQYLEIRSLDLNIFDKCGVSEIDLDFLNLFMVFLLLEGEELFETWQQEALINERLVAEHGLDPELELLDQDHWTSKRAWSEDILEKITQIDDYLDLGQKKCIDVMMDRVKNIQQTYAYRIKKLISTKGYIEGTLELAQKYKKEVKTDCYQLKGFEEWKTASQILIKEALTRGIKLKGR
jgi:glutamate--cysteine ligase